MRCSSFFRTTLPTFSGLFHFSVCVPTIYIFLKQAGAVQNGRHFFLVKLFKIILIKVSLLGEKEGVSYDSAQVETILWLMYLSAVTSFSGGLSVRCLVLMDDVKHRRNHHLCFRTSQWDTLRLSKCFSNNKRKCKVNQIVMKDQSPARKEQDWRLK